MLKIRLTQRLEMTPPDADDVSRPTPDSGSADQPNNVVSFPSPPTASDRHGNTPIPGRSRTSIPPWLKGVGETHGYLAISSAHMHDRYTVVRDTLLEFDSRLSVVQSLFPAARASFDDAQRQIAAIETSQGYPSHAKFWSPDAPTALRHPFKISEADCFVQIVYYHYDCIPIMFVIQNRSTGARYFVTAVNESDHAPGHWIFLLASTTPQQLAQLEAGALSMFGLFMAAPTLWISESAWKDNGQPTFARVWLTNFAEVPPQLLPSPEGRAGSPTRL